MLKKIFSNKSIKFISILVIVSSLGYGGFKYINQREKTSMETIEIQEEKVQRGDITIDFEGDGEAEIPVVNLDFNISGKLEELYVKEGDVIKEGQVLARLDDEEYQKKLLTAQINYKKALASLKQKKENIKLSLLSEKQKLNDLKSKMEQIESEYLPMVELKDVYSKQALDIKKREYENSKLDYETQLERFDTLSNSTTDMEIERANIESSKISLEMVQDNLEDTVLISPLEAKVLNIAYKPGETISNSKDTGEVTADTSHFMVVSDSDKVEVSVPVSEIDLAKVKINQRVEMEFEAYENQIFIGKVVAIDELPKKDSSGIVTFDVRIELDDAKDKIKTGMTCEVSFILKQKKDVLFIPNKAVEMLDGKQAVKVRNKEGNEETRNIKTGLTDGKYVEIIEGLSVGETIIIKENKVK